MNMNKKELLVRELAGKLSTFEGRELNDQEREQYNKLNAEYTTAMREWDIELKSNAAQRSAAPMDKSASLREITSKVRTRQMDGEFNMQREVLTTGLADNIPVTINEIINPLESGLIYNQLGIKVATGVRGKLQWPVLDSAIEATVAGEADEIAATAVNFDKIVATPTRVGIVVEVSNEALNDAAFDLHGTVVTQLRKGVERTLNNRVLALAAPSAQPDFVGPLVGKKQTLNFALDIPTYQELKKMKGQVLGSGAQMAGFCYVMDAAMFSALEGASKDNGSGRFIIENGKIDGDPVFVTNIAAYANKVVAGCFGYEALNQHGDMKFIIDPYTAAAKNVTRFILNADFSLTYLVRGKDKAPFSVGAKA